MSFIFLAFKMQKAFTSVIHEKKANGTFKKINSCMGEIRSKNNIPLRYVPNCRIFYKALLKKRGKLHSRNYGKVISENYRTPPKVV